ncbi:SDR family NAD(P)-dependent oxidoreductase [Rhodopseudomonas sp. B29]|uniref:SDR family NAD(P)-dependent oxidoreductase n=1 Tax=Rhodopseudomonas sp. B29 TaxID=95607 RepID=UPI00131ED79D|nr:SDR family NAD(P)-dependent oxidoreductase [Rhodopseudomonas sp. B29]
MPKTLLITGASRGLGRDIAETSARAGYRVFASMRDPHGRNRERANALWSQGIDVVSLDVTNDDSVERAVQTVLRKTPRIDVLVNNAGIASAGITEAFTPAQFQALLDTNVVGLLRTARAVLPGMRRAGAGLIINIGSTMGRITHPFLGLHAAGKFAVEALTDSLRYEVSSFGVNVVLVQQSSLPTSNAPTTCEPVDKEREESYGDMARLSGAVLQRVSTSFRAEAVSDLHEVSVTVTELIDSPAGTRPARSIVGTPNGVDEINQSTARLQQQWRDQFGLRALAGGGKDDGGTPTERPHRRDDRIRARETTGSALKIWGRANSINVQKVLWCCGELRLDYVRIDAGSGFGISDTPEYLAMNPNGLVPTIEDGSFTLWESNAIVRYLAHKTADNELCPSDIQRRFDAERWMDWQATTFWAGLRPLFVQLVRTSPEQRSSEIIAAAEQSSLNCVRVLDAWLADRPYITGEHFSFGDIPVATTVHRWLMLDIDHPRLPNLDRWYGRMTEREHFRDVVMKPLS